VTDTHTGRHTHAQTPHDGLRPRLHSIARQKCMTHGDSLVGRTKMSNTLHFWAIFSYT